MTATSLPPLVKKPVADRTLVEQSKAGRTHAPFVREAVGVAPPVLPPGLARTSPPRLPDVSEPELVRHFVRLSQRNVSIDTTFYPLGSCTMKYNPKAHERIASLDGFAQLHPLQYADGSQGALTVMYELEQALGALSGLPAVALQPAAGAHGEFAGLLIMRAWHERNVARGITREMPTHVIIPDTAHGTNPASVTMAGFKTLSVRTDEHGGMDVEALRSCIADHDVVGLMLTNPSTLGLFDTNIKQIADIVHEAGGLLYYDGANLNAIMGRCRPGDMGFDIVHFNTHKSFSTPHGGGGPGAGPIAVTDELEPFLPSPRTVRLDDGTLTLEHNRPDSVGRMRMYWGNFGVLLRAWAYIRTLGPDGLREASELAVLNANYILARIAPAFEKIYGRRCMHEFVVSAASYRRQHNVRALDIAKRLIDYGFHPPTMYFPLLVEEAIMVEPTETESRETLDSFADAVLAIIEEVRTDPDLVRTAPHTTRTRRVDETRAVRQPILHG